MRLAGFIRRTADGAHESNLPFLSSALTFDAIMAFIPLTLLILLTVSTVVTGSLGPGADASRLLDFLLPPHQIPGGRDPLAGAEALLARIAEQRTRLSLVALPLFVWFSTRLFASIRGSLNLIYGAQAGRPAGGVIVGYLKGKLRDLGMVLAVIVLALVHTILSSGLAILTSRGTAASPALAPYVSTAFQVVGHLLAFTLLVTLFLLLYRYASFRRLEWRGAIIASIFSAVAFEIAKRLFGLYLTRVVSLERMSLDANIGAIILAMLWMWYTAFVFLLGAVVADTWEHPDRPHRTPPIPV